MIFKPASRYPADPRAVFVLAFSVFVGMIALVIDAQPGTLQAALPTWGVVLWGATLVAGSATALIGMWRQTINGIIIEQIGSVAVSMSTTFYSVLMIWLVGPQSYMSAGIILAWGIACGLRWVQLQILIETAYRKKLIEEAQEEIKHQILDPEDGDEPSHDH